MEQFFGLTYMSHDKQMLAILSKNGENVLNFGTTSSANSGEMMQDDIRQRCVCHFLRTDDQHDVLHAVLQSLAVVFCPAAAHRDPLKLS